MKPVTKVCRACGKPFDTTKQHNIFCSSKCRNDWKHAMANKDFVKAISKLWSVDMSDNKTYSTDISDSDLTTETVSRLITERTVGT